MLTVLAIGNAVDAVSPQVDPAILSEILFAPPDVVATTAVQNVRPVLVVALDQTVEEGELLDLSAMGAPPLALFIDDDIHDMHTVTVDWGDGTAVATPVMFSNGNGSVAVGGSHTYADNGNYTVTVDVVDDGGGRDTKQFLVSVENVDPIAVLTNNGPLDEGSSATVTFSGQFDPGTADTTAAFHYAYDLDNNGTFDLGDGTYSGSDGTSSQLVSAAMLAEGPGMHTVKGRIIDKDGGFTDYTTTIMINNVAPELINIVAEDAAIDEGQTATIKLTINDPGAMDVFEVDVDWKDGAQVDTIAGLGMASVSGTVGGSAYQWDAQSRELTVSHLYADDDPTVTANDPYSVTLAVRDDESGTTGPYNLNITVSNVRPVLVVAVDQTVNEGALLDLTGMVAPPLALFIDDGVADTHTVTVDWGDGSAPEMPTMFVAGGSVSVGGSHIYADNGNYIVTVLVVDDDGGSDTQSFKVIVRNVNPTLIPVSSQTVDAGSALSITNIGTITDPGFQNLVLGTNEIFRYWINWGDGTVVDMGNAAIDDIGGVMDLTDASFAGSHTYAENGLYSVTLRVADDDMTANFVGGTGGTDFVEQSFSVTVRDPSLIPPPVDPGDPNSDDRRPPSKLETTSRTLFQLLPLPPLPSNRGVVGDEGSGGKDLGGSGGGPDPPDTLNDAERTLQELLSEPRGAKRDEVIDAVYSLGDIELVSLLGIDMGDEPVSQKKQSLKKPVLESVDYEPAPSLPPDPVVASGESARRTVAFWSALAGSMLSIGGGLWWFGWKRRRITKRQYVSSIQ